MSFVSLAVPALSEAPADPEDVVDVDELPGVLALASAAPSRRANQLPNPEVEDVAGAADVGGGVAAVDVPGRGLLLPEVEAGAAVFRQQLQHLQQRLHAALTQPQIAFDAPENATLTVSLANFHLPCCHVALPLGFW